MRTLKKIMDLSFCVALICVLLAIGGIDTTAIGTTSAFVFFTTFVITVTNYLRHENK